MSIFRLCASGFLVFFMGLMIFVTILAYSRKAGSIAGMDKGKIEQVRVAGGQDKS